MIGGRCPDQVDLAYIVSTYGENSANNQPFLKVHLIYFDSMYNMCNLKFKWILYRFFFNDSSWIFFTKRKNPPKTQQKPTSQRVNGEKEAIAKKVADEPWFLKV